MTEDKPTKPRWKPDPSKLPAVGPDGVRLLSGGNPQIAKGDGEGPVRAYLAAMPGWKRAIGQEIDLLVGAAVPDVRKAVRWNAPFWGRDGAGWMLSLSCTARYVKVSFLNGSGLRPPPPVASKHDAVRYLHVFEAEGLDEARMRDWIAQAFALPGMAMF